MDFLHISKEEINKMKEIEFVRAISYCVARFQLTRMAFPEKKKKTIYFDQEDIKAL